MEYCYDFVRFFIYCKEDIMFINFFEKLIKNDWIEILCLYFKIFSWNIDFSKVKYLVLVNNEYLLGYLEICVLFFRCIVF